MNVSETLAEALFNCAWPTARPEDVSSVEALINAFDQTLQFEPGQFDGNMDRLKSLFLPNANVASTLPWSLATDATGFASFIQKTIPMMEANKIGFGECNKIMRKLSIGDVHSVYTFYTLHMPSSNETPMGQGVNMFHIVKLEGRYWIASLVWEDESEAAPTPADLRPSC
jgi:hypothetical protein